MGKRLFYAFIIGCLGFATTMQAYRKFCCATYQNPRDNGVAMDGFEEIMHRSAHFWPLRATYVFAYDQGAMRCYVKLKNKEKRIIRIILSGYDRSTVITPDFIAQYIEHPRSKFHVVGWVLEDFVYEGQARTIGEILGRLGML